MSGFLGVPVFDLIGFALAGYGACMLGRRVAGWIARAVESRPEARPWGFWMRPNGTTELRRGNGP